MEKVKQLRDNMNKAFIGKEDVVENMLVCLLAGGHVLIEDVPGLGKTTLANALANSVQCSFGRMQCTPDSLPTDVTGVSIYNQKTGEFEFREGVVMNQVLLVDEINRATPKTQSSLLEAMAEGQVSVDGNIYTLPQPFMVIATQNPSEYVGTYPLPEAQIDRFMMCLSIGYPEKEQELEIARHLLSGELASKAEAVCTTEEILAMKKEVEQVKIAEPVLSYIVDIIRATREEEKYVVGASPRAMLALVRASQAKAYLSERDYVKPDDVKAVVKPVLMHRLVLTTKARGQENGAEQVFHNLLLKVRVPV